MLDASMALETEKQTIVSLFVSMTAVMNALKVLKLVEIQVETTADMTVLGKAKMMVELVALAVAMMAQ